MKELKAYLNLEKKYVLAISGGSDSMVLGEGVSRSLPSSHLVVAHFNHQTRPLENLEEECLVKAWAEKKQIQFYSEKYQGQKKDEDSLRKARRAFLLSVLEKTKSDAILTAHHLEDQFETFLMRLIRGTGLSGLGGMKAVQLPWIKPFLEISKETLLKMADKWNVPFLEDSSNAKPGYFRNEIRLELIPIFKKLSKKHGGYESFLNRFAMLAEETQSLPKVEKKTWVETPVWFRVAEEDWKKLTPQEKSAQLESMVNALDARKDWTRKKHSAALKAFNEKIKQAVVSKQFVLRYSCGFFFIQNEKHIQNFFESQRWTQTSTGKYEQPILGIQVNFKDFHGELRTFLPGDRIQKKKLKEIFLTHRIPLLERRLLPIAVKTDSHEVLWTPLEPSSKVAFSYPPDLFSF